MSNVDFSLIARQALSRSKDILVRLFPRGKFQGKEFVVGSLQGDPGTSLSINIDTGKWCDFSTGDKGGDLISLLAARDRMSQKDAAEEMSLIMGMPSDNLEAKRPEQSFISDLHPKQDPSSHNHPRHGKPAATWVYRDFDGSRMFYIHRFNMPDGKKEICPQVFGNLANKKGWYWRQVKDNRPMYGLDRLARSKNTVLVVEGEKCADALAQLAGTKLACISWCGGSSAVGQTDWKPLKGRKVVIWPDADQKKYKGSDKIMPLAEQPGYKAAQKVAYYALQAGAEEAIVIEFDYKPFKDGWDVADAIEAGWDFAKIISFIKEGIENSKKVEPAKPEETHEEKVDKKKKKSGAGLDELPFECLGYNHNNLYYAPRNTGQLSILSPSGHTKQNLLYINPDLPTWRKAYPSESKPFWDIDATIADMMKECQSNGVFDLDNIRGRGAWIDNDRVVVHLGNRMMVDGVIQETMKVKDSDYFYELAGGFSPPSTDFISSQDARDLYEMMCKFRWANPLYPLMALGWCIMGPFCGAFRYRPHIWITGPAGAGKTWIQDNVINRIVGDYALMATSASTEAGIRSALKCDARPVIFDEAEAHDAEGARKMQKILELARQSSSESEAQLYKGASTGGFINYRIRSSFCFSSIGVNITQVADQSRISILTLNAQEKYDEEKIAHEIEMFKEAALYCSKMDDDFIDRIHGRTIRYLKEITESAERFSTAFNSLLRSQRNADQVGFLCGVAQSWLEGRVFSEEEATKWGALNKVQTLVNSVIETDDRRCLDHIMDQIVHVRSDKGTPHALSISQLVHSLRFDLDLYNGWVQGGGLEPKVKDCVDALGQRGIKVKDKDTMLIANSNAWLAGIFKETQWMHAGWPNALKQIEGADNNLDRPERFAGAPKKCTRIILSIAGKAAREELEGAY